MAGGLIGRGGKGRGRYRPMGDINVTPLVDVMPMMTSGVNVDLPKTEAKPLNTDAKPLTVSMNADGKLYLQDEPVELSDLVTKLTAVADNDMDRRIFVRADKGISYGQVMTVMATVAQGGFTKVALLAEQPAGTAPPKPGG
jgi:biopolymer transport protein TolR